MFDLTSSKLLILAVVALIVVGPKDLPILLRTLGKYLGVIRRQAAEFRGQLNEAMREAELDHIQKEFEGVKREVRATMDAGARAIDSQIDASSVNLDGPKGEQAATPAIVAAKPADATQPDAPLAPDDAAAKKPGREGA